MAERKPWTQREDQILKDLREVRQITKWSQIALIMKTQFQIFGRNGKQCRERFHNHLDSRICKQKWGAQQEKKLLELHNEMGNRWAAISRELPGRTDNCVKNHFYSYFRKCIKNVNYSISTLSERKIRPLKLSIMNKIISFIEAYHKSPLGFDRNAYMDAKELKDKIFSFSEISTVTQQNCRQKLQELSKKLADLNKTSRKKYIKKKRVKVDLDESEQLQLKSKQQSEQLEHESSEVKREVKNEPLPEESIKLYLPTCNSHSRINEIKQEEQDVLKERQADITNMSKIEQANLMVNSEVKTPQKQGRQEKEKNSSYCVFNSVDYLDVKYQAPNIQDFIFMDDQKDWKLYFE